MIRRYVTYTRFGLINQLILYMENSALFVRSLMCALGTSAHVDARKDTW